VTADEITSAANPLIKRVRSLAERRTRRREGAFVVEGVQPVWRAIEAGWHVETLLVVSARLPDSAARLVAEQRAAGTRIAEIAEQLAARVAERDTPPGLLAVVSARATPLDELPVESGSVFVALSEVGNPGNLGTVIRTADAVGASGVILVGDTADQYAPAAVKASMGSLFAVPVVRARDSDELFGWAASERVEVVATSGYAEQDHWSGPYSTPVAVLLGSEGEGLPDEDIRRADRVARIPMVGTAESSGPQARPDRSARAARDPSRPRAPR
jgi:TrmH family RNA methyltransferase